MASDGQVCLLPGCGYKCGYKCRWGVQGAGCTTSLVILVMAACSVVMRWITSNSLKHSPSVRLAAAVMRLAGWWVGRAAWGGWVPCGGRAGGTRYTASCRLVWFV